MHRLAGIFAAFVILCGSALSPALAQDKSLTVFAAASMKNALDDIDTAFTARTGVKIIASYAASSTLARQIEQGAPADVFLSADIDWMDYATAKTADTKRYGAFFRAMLDRGIYLAPSQFEAAFLSAAHSDEDIRKTVAAAGEAFSLAG